MRKTLLLLIAGLFSVTLIKSQSIEDIFLSMPSEITPVIHPEGRQELMKLYKAGEKAEVQGVLKESCSMTAFQDNYIRIATGSNSIEIISLPMINDSHLLLVIKTVCIPACDSELSFYTVQWKKLNMESLLQPVGKDWFILEGTDTNDQAAKNTLLALDINLMKFSYNPETKQLIQEYQTPEYLDKEQKKNVEKYLKQEAKTYQWTGMRFEE